MSDAPTLFTGACCLLAGMGFVARFGMLSGDATYWAKVEGRCWEAAVLGALLLLGATLASHGAALVTGSAAQRLTRPAVALCLTAYSLVLALNLHRQRRPPWLAEALAWLRDGDGGPPAAVHDAVAPVSEHQASDIPFTDPHP